MTTVLLLLLCVTFFAALGASGTMRMAYRWPGSPLQRARRIALVVGYDVVRGARTLSRLDGARRDRLGRPWA